jgi:hypothetical protein
LPNTYRDDLARGLSKLQIAILVWLNLMYRLYLADPEYLAQKKEERELIEIGLGIPWRKRPSFYGRPGKVPWENKKYHSVESAGISRALRRLEDRGLILRNYNPQESRGTRVTHVALTDLGIEVSNRLTQDRGGRYNFRDIERERNLKLIAFLQEASVKERSENG